MMSMRDRGNTDRTKDKKISYLGGIPVRLVLVGRSRCKLLTPVPQRLTTGSKMLISGRTGTGVESGPIRGGKFLVDYGHYEPTGPKVCASRALGHALEGHESPSLQRKTKRISLVSPAEQKQRNTDVSDLRR